MSDGCASRDVLILRMQYSSVAMLYYDYILTFSDELRYIWRKGSLMRFSTLLYICCRYALLGNLVYLLVFAAVLDETCLGWFRLVGILSVVGRAAIITVLGMRAYAMCARSKLVLSILLPLGAAVVGLVIVQEINPTAEYYTDRFPIPQDILSVLVPLYDFIATAFTTIRGCQLLRYMRPGATPEKLQGTLQYLLVEQGVRYFIAVSIINITISVVQFHKPTASEVFLTHLCAFATPLSGIMTARFLLRLREHAEHTQSIPIPNELLTVQDSSRTEEILSTIIASDPQCSRQISTWTSTATSSFSSLRRVMDCVVEEFEHTSPQWPKGGQGGDAEGG